MPKRIAKTVEKKTNSIFATLAISLTLVSFTLPMPAAVAQQYTDAQGRPVSKDVYDGVQLMNEASQFLNQNKNAEAVFRLERAAQLAPDVADVHYNYGIALAKMGQTEDAVKQYQDATRLNADMPYAWINLGACYQLLGKIEEAVQTYTEFVTRFPSNPEAGKIKSLVVGLNKELGRQTNLPTPRQSAPPQAQVKQPPPQNWGGFRPNNTAPQGFGTPQTAKVDSSAQGGTVTQGSGTVGYSPPPSQGLSGWQGSGGSEPRDPGGLVNGQPSQGLSGWQGTPEGQPGVSAGSDSGSETGQGGFQQSGGGFPQGSGGFQQNGRSQQGGQTGYAQQNQQPADPNRFGPPDEPPAQTHRQPQMQRPPAAVQRPAQPAVQPPPKKPVQVASGVPPQNPTGQPQVRPPGASGHPGAPSGSSPAGTTAGGSNGAPNYLNDVGGARLGKWPSDRMPLKVCIVPADNVKGYQPEFNQVLIKCFQDWGNSSGGKVSFKGTSEQKGADILCTWTSDTGKFMNTAEAGETTVYGSKNGIQHVTIQILTVPHPMSPGVPLSENRLRWICLHEIGHALGLGGHTRNPQDIMFFSTPLAEVRKELTPRDCNTIQSLYSK